MTTKLDSASDQACPDRALLVAFLRGEVMAPRLADVEFHVSQCASCVEKLGALESSPDPLVRLVRRGQQRLHQFDGELLRRFELQLESHFGTRTITVAESATELLPEEVDDFSPSVWRLEATNRIGRFEILDAIGHGSYGEVYRAYDPQLDREVAIKLGRRRGNNAQKRNTFLAEARKAVRCIHPHIVAVYDAGWSEEYGPYMVMEYLKGGTLKDRIRAAVTDANDAFTWMDQIALGLHAGHKKRLVHRDLKPANILFDEHGHAKVADFGLALFEQTQSESRSEVAGSPPYMAPEQVRGEAHVLDGRSDIWALGVIAYECLAGFRPFAGDSREELFEQILTRDPKPLQQLRDDLPSDAVTLIHGCLAKAPADRPASARDVHRVLHRISRPARKLSRRLVLGSTLGGIGLGALAAFVAVRSWPHLSDGAVPPTRDGRTDLLLSPPEEIVWDPADSDTYGNPLNEKALTISSSGWSALQLGTAVSPTFEVEIKFSAAEWGQEFFGAFWSAPTDIQFIERNVEVPIPALLMRPAGENRLEVSLVALTLKRFSRQSLFVKRLPAAFMGETSYNPNAANILHLEIRDGELANVRFQERDVPLRKLNRRNPDSANRETHSPGGLGVVCSTGFFVVRRATLLER